MLDKLLMGEAVWFGVPALVATTLFIIRMLLMAFGHAHDVELHDLDVGEAETHDAAGAFKALSVQTLTAFAMGFGWGGIAGLYTLRWDFAHSLIAAAVSGVAMVWVLAMLLKAVGQLHRSGNIDIETAVGLIGEVYVGIPARGEGSGQVRVVMSERMRILNAQSEEGPVLTNTRVRVVHVNGDNTVTVTPVV